MLLIQDCLLSAQRKLEAARNEIKAEGRMTLGLEDKFTDILSEISALEKTVVSWIEDGNEE